MKKSFTGIVCLLFIVVACNKNNNHDNNDDTLSKMDRNFITSASYANNSEVAAGAVASGKASDTAVRSFGAFMVSEHTTAQNDLRSLAGKWHIETPTTPDSMHIVLMKMMEPLQGRMFDTTYMRSQVNDHITAMDLFQQEAANGENQKLKDYANKYLPHIMMHKQMADSILMKLK
jgi:putative membrane protein